jgi:hypothetical protein
VGQEDEADGSESEWETNDGEEDELEEQQHQPREPDAAPVGQHEGVGGGGAAVHGGAGDPRRAPEAQPPAGAAFVAEVPGVNPALVVVVDRDDYAPFILKGVWKYAPEQRKLMARLRYGWVRVGGGCQGILIECKPAWL